MHKREKLGMQENEKKKKKGRESSGRERNGRNSKASQRKENKRPNFLKYNKKPVYRQSSTSK